MGLYKDNVNIVENVYVNNYIDKIRGAINDKLDIPEATYANPHDLPDLIRQINSDLLIVLHDGQYNPTTREPSIVDPSSKVIYLVPKTDPNTNANDYIEWVWVNNIWERVGDDARALTNTEIDEACGE